MAHRSHRTYRSPAVWQEKKKIYGENFRYRENICEIGKAGGRWSNREPPDLIGSNMDCLINSAWIELNWIFSFPTIKYIAHLFLFEEDLGPNQISKTKLKGPRTLPCGTPHAHVLWVWDTYTYIIFLRPLRLCTLCVSWGISPAQTLLIAQSTAIRHSFFLFLPLFYVSSI